MYKVYLNNVMFPIAPSKMTTKIKNKNKTITLINEGEVNTLKTAGLTEISFDLMIPQVQYPFAVYQDGFKSAEYYLTVFDVLKTSKKPFQFICSRVSPSGKLLFDTNIKVSLEDYKIVEDAKKGLDLTVTVKLKMYREYGTKTIKIIKPTSTKMMATGGVKKTRSTASTPKVKTHTVKKGDCLWNIAKKYLGKGSRYKEIYNLNKDKIKNPNRIYPGQVLTLPS